MMTKIYRHNLFSLLMVALLLVGASSCQKERFVIDTPDEEQKGVTPSYGSTYMSLNLRTGGGSSFSEDQDYNYQGAWAGTDDITSFAVFVISEDRDEVHCISSNKIIISPAEYSKDWQTWGQVTNKAVLDPNVQKWENNVLTLTPWQTSPGKKTIYAFLNPPAQYVEYLKQTLSSKASFLEAIKKPIPFQGEAGMTYTTTADAPKLGGFRPDPNIAKKVIYKGLNENSYEYTTEPLTGFSTDKIKSFDNRAFDFNSEPAKGSCDFVKYADHIMCSGIKEDFAVTDNVSKSEVANSRTNLAVVSVRRVLAQAVVSWDEKIIGDGLKGDPEKEKMELKGIYYQVLNFEPTFYPIAERSDSEWFNIKNTKSPSYDDLTPTDLINFNTYHPYGEENFDPITLEDERFFRNSIPVNKSMVMPPSTDNAIPNLLRQKVLLVPGKVEDDASYNKTGFKFPYETPSVRWGGCYLTETTHPWGAGEDSGYRKGNTPFFAVIASFAIKSLPWDESALSGRKKREEDLQKKIAEVKASAEQARRDSLALEQQLVLEKEELANFESSIKDSKNWGKAAEYTKALNNRDEWQEKYNAATGRNRKAAYKKELEKAQALVNKLRKDYYDAKKDSDGYSKHIAAENQVTTTEAKIAEAKKKIASIDKEIERLTEEADKIEVAGVTYDDGDDITPITYAHGINRIYYSLDTQKFYLNYHDIPADKRGGNHKLKTTDDWYTNITNAIPAGVAIPVASQTLLDKFSEVLNGKIKAETLPADEQRAMDFYLYGRVAPDLVPAFKQGARKYDYIDLRLGYVEEYTAKHKDKVVNYEILTRYRGTDTASETRYNENQMLQTRLLMVYYAWVNPSTNDNRTWYSSPVLRNNIYHMHITGFTKMGLSGIPFVKKPDDPRFSFLHNIDPDEKVPSKDEYLPIESPYMGVQVNNVGWGIHSFKKQF
ncbi:fimbria major subunit [Porphyromonas somerae]|uniref:fimbria major subunit n=1 Tax=Porphyromonas somerae TaxID=322095 RepID=UPI0003652789|nr:fimbria major subunit [Porphyromonas somerae]